MTKHVFIGQGRMECRILVPIGMSWLPIRLNVSKFRIVHHAHVGVSFRHLVDMCFRTQLLLLHHDCLRTLLLQRVGLTLRDEAIVD